MIGVTGYEFARRRAVPLFRAACNLECNLIQINKMD